ncbi:MAG: hypothetical protein E7671_01860 [Ruminococcaceae bacterium]|nr:hypothetical protein [Oscillospiraceae bacterium]
MKNLNKTKLTIIIAVVLALAISASILAAAAYDSTNDPLISLSYLTKYVEEALAPVKEAIASLGGDVDTPATVATGFEAIFVEYGKQIQCTAATEIILRSGTAEVVSPFDNQGLSDLTDGTDLKGGASVPKNHNLLIPRGEDGRGIVITSSSGAYVMVGGAYIIVEP